MTVLEIVNFAAQSTGDVSQEALDYARDALRLKYKTLYDTHNWREAQRTIDGVLDPNLGGSFFLAIDAEEVLSLSISYDGISFSRLTYRERDWIERFGPSYGAPGGSPWFYRGENLAWPYVSPGHISFGTADPVPFPAYISGVDANGFPISESFSLQGLNNPGGTTGTVTVQTQNSYDKIFEISKGAGSTPLSIADDNSNMISVPGATSDLVFTQMVLYPVPAFNGNPVYVRTHCKLKADALSNDMSVPRISHIWEALVCFVKAALYERMQQVQKSQAMEQIAMQHIQAATNIEKNQSEFRQQVVPIVYEQGLIKVDSINPFGYS